MRNRDIYEWAEKFAGPGLRAHIRYVLVRLLQRIESRYSEWLKTGEEAQGFSLQIQEPMTGVLKL